MEILRDILADPLFGHATAILLIVLGALLVRSGLHRALERRVPRLALQPMRLVAKYAVLAVAALLILGRFYDLAGVWAALTTILAIVGIGFVAVWSVLSNAMCTFVLILSRPFRVGDHVEVVGDGVSGRVIDLTLIYTTLRAEDGALVRVPNNLFFQRVVRCKESSSQIELEEQLKRSEPAG